MSPENDPSQAPTGDTDSPPSDQGLAADAAPTEPGLGTAGPGLAQEPAAPPPPTVETLAGQVETLDKRLSDTQDALRQKSEEAAQLRTAQESRIPQPGQQAPVAAPQPVQQPAAEQPGYYNELGYPVDPYAPASPQAPAQPQPQQPSVFNDPVAAQLLIDTRLESSFPQVEKAIGLELSDEDRTMLKQQCLARGTMDLLGVARNVLQPRIVKQAEDAAIKKTREEARASQEGVQPKPTGQAGQPESSFSPGTAGIGEALDALKSE